VNRRAFLRVAAGGAGLSMTACRSHGKAAPPCRWTMSSFARVSGFEPHQVFRIGPPAAPSVVLLHEMTGLSEKTFALAQCLHDHQLTVYLPLLFGSVGQDNATRGYVQACLRGPFECSAPSTTSRAIVWIEALCLRASELASAPVGVIGMCLTGSFPLALLRDRAVGAAVVCQPTLPFSAIRGGPADDQKTDLGISGKDLAEAVRSDVSILALHYAQDPKSPDYRMERLEDIFKERVAVARLEGDRHSTLVGDHHSAAFADTVNYLKVRLGADPGPKAMQIAKLRGGIPCEITPSGRWRAV
jgi:dienelactone hydrolase